jgi:hypothetical protein
MHCDEQARYGCNDFGQFLDIVNYCNDVLHHVWVIETSLRIEYATFLFYGKNYMLYKHYTLTRCLNWVSRLDWLMVIVQDVKKQCNNVIHGLIEKL